MSFTHLGGCGKEIQNLPNISIALGEDLRRAGFKTADDLIRCGVEEVWERLRVTGRHDDFHTLLALEGAARGTHWRSLPHERRAELLRYASHSMDRSAQHAA